MIIGGNCRTEERTRSCSATTFSTLLPGLFRLRGGHSWLFVVSRRTNGRGRPIIGDVAMVLGNHAVFLGLVQIVSEHLSAMSLRGNFGERRTAPLKFSR